MVINHAINIKIYNHGKYEKNTLYEFLKVNFKYREDGENKNALVKLRIFFNFLFYFYEGLCPYCSLKLNYHHQK